MHGGPCVSFTTDGRSGLTMRPVMGQPHEHGKQPCGATGAPNRSVTNMGVASGAKFGLELEAVVQLRVRSPHTESQCCG